MLRVALFAALINVAFGAWTLKTSGVSTDLEDVACYGSACWTVGDGGIILKSTDCGSTWSPQTSGVTVDLKSIAAKSATDAIAVGKEGVIISTADGGSTPPHSYTPPHYRNSQTTRLRESGHHDWYVCCGCL